MKFAFGILTGILILFTLFLGYRMVINPYYKLSIPKFIIDTTKTRPAQEDIIALKSQLLISDEKIGSVNKRLDDLLIFGGIIITLILAINVGVYVNADKSVDKHMESNFNSHKKRIESYLKEVEETAGKVKAEFELVQNIRKNAQSIQPI